MAQNQRIIKKYPNRRLYDTKTSRYITLKDVRRLIVDDEPFEIRDARNGDDLTRPVLLQIIAEYEANGHEPVLSSRVLRGIIHLYGDAMQGLVGPYLETSLDIFLAQQHRFQQHLDQLLGNTPWAVFAQINASYVEMWTSLQSQLADAARKRMEDEPGANDDSGTSSHPPRDESES